MKNKIVFVSGQFNILHPGHVRLLSYAKKLGNKLIVGVLSDKLSSQDAHIHEKLRYQNVKTITWIDEVYLIKDSLKKAILKFKPDIVLKGNEHESYENDEESIVKTYGGKLLFASGESTFSSFDLIKKELISTRFSRFSFPKNYIQRRKIKKKNIVNLINRFKNKQICVLGDFIIDKYIECEALGMSAEDNCLVFKSLGETSYLGGAGIVAAHSASLGAKTKLITVVGSDINIKETNKKLIKHGVSPDLIKDDTRKTTIKKRYINLNKSVMRISNLSQNYISLKIQKQIIKKFKKIVKKIDCLIFSDFNYGCLPNKMIEEIIDLCLKNNVWISADCQTSSQIGDIAKYKNVNLITPTEKEARVATRNQDSGLISLCEQLRNHTKVDNIILKLGIEGVLIHSSNKIKRTRYFNDRIPALNSNPTSVMGAGDCLLVGSSLSLISGADIWEASYIGSISAALQVDRVGNIPLKFKVLKNELNENFKI